MINHEEEIWKDVVGYEGLYQVSSLGRIKSMPNTKRSSELILVGNDYRFGYLRVTLYKIGHKRRMFRVHRMVADAFIQNPQNKPFVNHKNGIKTDNRVDNLEWCTHKENITHAYDNGFITKTPKNRKDASKPIRQINDIGQVIAEFPSGREAERQTGFHCSNINLVLTKKKKKAYGFYWEYSDKTY